MANGATETLEIFFRVMATGTYENVATVSSSSFNPGTNSSGVVIDVIRNGTNGTNGSGTVPMQHTGVPIALLAFALVMMVAGIAIPTQIRENFQGFKNPNFFIFSIFIFKLTR